MRRHVWIVYRRRARGERREPWRSGRSRRV